MSEAQHFFVVRFQAVRLWFFARSIAAMALLFLSPAPNAYSDTIVSGSIDSVQLEARESSVAEVLKALSEAFPIRYQTTIVLDQAVTGTFKGPALKIIARVLQDYDHVVRRTAAGEIEVVVVKLSGRDSSKVVSAIVGAPSPAYPATEVNTGNATLKGGPYPHPQWRARSYSRTMQPKTAP